MLTKFYMNTDLVKKWYTSKFGLLLLHAEDPRVAAPHAASAVVVLASVPQHSAGVASLDPPSTLTTAAATTGGSDESATTAALLEGLVEVNARLVEFAKACKLNVSLKHCVD